MTIQTTFKFVSHSQRIKEAREFARNELRKKDINICEVLKERGIKKVLNNIHGEFKEQVMEEIVRVANNNNVFTMDDIREACKNLNQPHSGNAWGALINAASRQKLIKKTGKYVKSKIPSNHGHLNAEWEKY